MPTNLRAFLLAVLVVAACGLQPAAFAQPPSLNPRQAASVEKEVRAFMQVVAQGITQQGPSAWTKYFAETPAFFMAVDGHLVFPDRVAASAGIRQAAQQIKQIQLVWGADLRVDPLDPHLAVVASSWHEVQQRSDGRRLDESGFFTAVAEFHDRRWQFRNAHWSLAAPPPPAAQH